MSSGYDGSQFGNGNSITPGSFLVGLLKVAGVLILGLLVVSMFLPVSRVRETTPRTQCRNNLKQIALALHNYHDEYGAFPPAYTVDANGRPLHSWRTLILPFLDEKRLYESIDLSKPWDDPANAEACKTGLAVYQCPSASLPQNSTSYLASVGPDAFFHPTEPRRIDEIKDGMSYTLMVIEADVTRAVPWMSPQDADAALVAICGQEPKPNHTGGTHAAFGDGSVRFLAGTLPAETRRALISIDGGELVGEF